MRYRRIANQVAHDKFGTTELDAVYTGAIGLATAKVHFEYEQVTTPIYRLISRGLNSQRFIREHEGLAGKTPADKAGIVITGDNKWKTIIENASNQKKV